LNTFVNYFIKRIISEKGKPAKRQGRKAIGSKVPLHYDSLAAALCLCA